MSPTRTTSPDQLNRHCAPASSPKCPRLRVVGQNVSADAVLLVTRVGIDLDRAVLAYVVPASPLPTQTWSHRARHRKRDAKLTSAHRTRSSSPRSNALRGVLHRARRLLPPNELEWISTEKASCTRDRRSLWDEPSGHYGSRVEVDETERNVVGSATRSWSVMTARRRGSHGRNCRQGLKKSGGSTIASKSRQQTSRRRPTS